MTAEKQTPSAIDYVGHMKHALEIEKRLLKPGQSKALRDILGSLCATYNKMAKVKKHRIDAQRKAMIYNLLLGYIESGVH